MSMAWVAGGTAVAGILGNLYGSNKQSKDQAHANDLNRQAVEQADLRNWQNYLMQRGLNPQGVTQFGAIPTNAQAVNTRLPLWATINQTMLPSGQTKLAAGPQGGAGGRRAVGFQNGQVIYA